MKKKEIIKKSSEFTNIIKKGNFKKNDFFVIYTNLNSNLKNSKFGITVPTKIGNAVIRNKIKRQIKDIVDKNKFLFQKNMEYIIMIRKGTENLKYYQLEKNLLSLIKGE